MVLRYVRAEDGLHTGQLYDLYRWRTGSCDKSGKTAVRRATRKLRDKGLIFVSEDRHEGTSDYSRYVVTATGRDMADELDDRLEEELQDVRQRHGVVAEMEG